MIRPLGIDHVVIRVHDLDRMTRFYEQVLGCAIERRIVSLGMVQLRAGRSLIDLVDASGAIGRAGGAPPGSEGHNVDHVCLRIESFDEAELRAHLGTAGVSIGEVSERYGAEGIGPSMYILDPEENTIELKGPPA